MSRKQVYFATSFGLFTVLSASMTISWWRNIPDEWWMARLILVGIGVLMTAGAAVMTAVAARTKYR